MSSSSRLRASSKQTINSSLNQINIGRQQEKTEMQSLNDRHANMVTKQRELLREIKTLKEQLRITEENAENRMRECRSTCERRVEQLMGEMDVERRESAKKQIDLEKYRQADKERQNEINVLVRDLKQLEKRNAILATELDGTRQKISSLTEEQQQLRKLTQNLETEKNALEKTMKAGLAQSEAERLRCVGLEGKVRALEEKLVREAESHERELEDLRAWHEQELEDQIEQVVETELRHQETELMLKSNREQEERVARTRTELERAHATELGNLREQLNLALSGEKELKAKIASLEPMIERLHARIHELNVKESSLNSRIGELEGLLEMVRTEQRQTLEQKDLEIRKLKTELNTKDTDHQLVVQANVQLNDEIDIYRNLLDEQEKSLQGDDDEVPPTTQRVTRTGSPAGPRRYSQAVRKRKRNDEVNETTIVNKSTGPIAIDESADAFIRLVNRSEEPVSLAGWELRRENDQDGSTFKFSKTVVVAPGESVTVYSVDAEGAEHRPPVAIRLKRNWPVGGVTTLVNAAKEEIARWEWSLQSKRSRFNLSGDEANKSCVLM